MKQIVQSLRNGVVDVVQVPLPQVGRNALRIRTSVSLISTGTERSMIEFGRANWLDKAKQQPDKVRMVRDKVKTDGLAATIKSVQNKLDQPLAPGYCNVGVVDAVGGSVAGFRQGQRVVSNGKHAEYAVVPKTLAAAIPDNVSDEDATFTVVGAVALQGIRLASVSLGESVAVMGLGLIGLLAVQLLRAQGCRVIGMDFDPHKLALAEKFGAEPFQLGNDADPVAAGIQFSRGRGVDAVLICAATDSNDPVHHAAQMSRKRGRIVLVGVAGLQLSRADFFEKELTFQVSCSYGPGRYDPTYEESGQDYPFGYVRWTEQRNFEAVLDMMACGALDCAALRSHEFPIDRAAEAYDLISGSAPSLGVLLRYPIAAEPEARAFERRGVVPITARAAARPDGVVVNAIGAGNYAAAVLLPAFRTAGATLGQVASATGLSAATQARRLGFAQASSDPRGAVTDPQADAVVIATRHDTHSAFVIDALRAGKHVFVEKPLALFHDQIDQIEACVAELPAKPLVMVGFNRRFAPHIIKIKQLISAVSAPKSFIYTVNAGHIPTDNWIQDRMIGGGRIIGECCHFIDLLRFLAGAPITHAALVGMDGDARDSVVIQLRFGDGSVGSIQYFANGHRGFPKERLEVFQAGRIFQLDNFRKLTAHGMKLAPNLNNLRQDKGQLSCTKAFVDAIKLGQESPIPFDELIEVARVTISLAEAA
ncbi:MAG: dehydrogenase [Proteobacteria bacterium SG_bin6]|nr:MAG: dehydrogenase [Proteobacteria bacterium SG_bin6]